MHTFVRSANDKSTQVQLAVKFTANPAANTSIFLAAIYNKQTEVITADGMVQSVRSLNV